MILDALEQRVLDPDRLPRLLEEFLEQSDASVGKRRDELASLRTDRTNSTGALNRRSTRLWWRTSKFAFVDHTRR